MLEDSPNQFGEPAVRPALPPSSGRARSAAIVGLVLLVVAVMAWIWFTSPVASGATETRTFTVQSGWGGGRIAGELKKAGLIRSVTAFIIYENITRTGDQLKAGTYLLSPGMSLAEIENIIAQGQALSTDIEVTIPEGMNTWDIDALLVKKGLLVKGSPDAAPGAFLARYHGFEGKLFPETYRIRKDDNFMALADEMVTTFQARADGYTDSEIVIASILEKEAKTADDMAVVSGIIAKRIKLGMPLQVDATVAYGWCERSPDPFCNVTQAPIVTEIKVDGPYNTYTRKGLPTGPISNPGLQALDAAAHPKDSPYLYYLSTRDGSQLIYAKTLVEHLQNRRKYLGF